MKMSKKPSDIKIEQESILLQGHRVPLLILRPLNQQQEAPGVLWIHGGGYCLGMKEMVYRSRAMDFVRNYGAVVVSPGYRLSWQKPYPAAIEDCHEALQYMKNHAVRLKIRSNQIFVGGESAGGGLAAALCMMARDRQTVQIAYQMPLYPMLDNFDTESSRNNHGRVWNTTKNHIGWKLYLRGEAKKEVSPYAAPARQTDYRNLPPAYTFVGTGEPFFSETKTYIEHLQLCGISAELDVYDMDMHAFDMMKPEWEISQLAAKRVNEHFAYAIKNYFSEQKE